MARPRNRFDILIVGDHPCAWLCAGIIAARSKSRIGVVVASKSSAPARLVHINPALFELDKSFGSIRKSLQLTETFGLEVLSDDPQKLAEHRAAKPTAFVGSLTDIQAALRKAASAAGVEIVKCRDFLTSEVDDATIACTADDKPVLTSLIAYAHPPKSGELRALGLNHPASESSARYAWCEIPSKFVAPLGDKPVLTMSLEFQGLLRWAWMLQHHKSAMAAIEVPTSMTASEMGSRLQHWCHLLERRERLVGSHQVELKSVQSMQIAPAGALTSETVGVRTLLFGEAGGFFSAGCEDIYPNCWSATCAAETLIDALAAKHAQDALQGYRARWGATLGDYLRGPQQNLRFLLPLIYRNKVMAARIAEAILSGASVVR